MLLLQAASGMSCGVWADEPDTFMPYEGMVVMMIVLLNAILTLNCERKAERGELKPTVCCSVTHPWRSIRPKVHC